MKMKLSKTKMIAVILVSVGLVWLGASAYIIYGMARGLQFNAISSGMRCQVHADIFAPLESKYNIRGCTVGFHRDDTIKIRIELNPGEQAQAFDIAGEVYELKQKSPVLSQKPLELKMWVHDPGVDGKRIVVVNPDSRYGVNLHIYMPGAPGHKKKLDLEEYEELDRKWREIRWQEEREKVRAASESAEERDEDDSD